MTSQVDFNNKSYHTLTCHAKRKENFLPSDKNLMIMFFSLTEAEM
jgi:hypothetical protein